MVCRGQSLGSCRMDINVLPSPWEWLPEQTPRLTVTRVTDLSVRFMPALSSSRMSTTAWELKKAVKVGQGQGRQAGGDAAATTVSPPPPLPPWPLPSALRATHPPTHPPTHPTPPHPRASPTTSHSLSPPPPTQALCPSSHPEGLPLLIEAHVGMTAAEVRLAFPDRQPAEVLQARLHGQVVTVGRTKLRAQAVLEPPRAVVAAADDRRWRESFGLPGDSTQDDVTKLWKGKPSKRRPDTLVLRGLPAKFFEVDMAALEDYEQNGELPTSSSFSTAPSSSSKPVDLLRAVTDEDPGAAADRNNAPTEVLRAAFGRFGGIRRLEVAMSGSEEAGGGGGGGGGSGGSRGGGSILSGGLGLGGLNFDAWVQFEEPSGVSMTLSALRGTVLTRGAPQGASVVVRVDVGVDVAGYFGEDRIRQRQQAREEKQRLALEDRRKREAADKQIERARLALGQLRAQLHQQEPEVLEMIVEEMGEAERLVGSGDARAAALPVEEYMAIAENAHAGMMAARKAADLARTKMRQAAAAAAIAAAEAAAEERRSAAHQKMVGLETRLKAEVRTARKQREADGDGDGEGGGSGLASAAAAPPPATEAERAAETHAQEVTDGAVGAANAALDKLAELCEKRSGPTDNASSLAEAIGAATAAVDKATVCMGVATSVRRTVAMLGIARSVAAKPVLGARAEQEAEAEAEEEARKAAGGVGNVIDGLEDEEVKAKAKAMAKMKDKLRRRKMQAPNAAPVVSEVIKTAAAALTVADAAARTTELAKATSQAQAAMAAAATAVRIVQCEALRLRTMETLNEHRATSEATAKAEGEGAIVSETAARALLLASMALRRAEAPKNIGAEGDKASEAERDGAVVAWEKQVINANDAVLAVGKVLQSEANGKAEAKARLERGMSRVCNPFKI